MSIVINNIEVIAKKLKAEFDIQTSSVEHNLLKGTLSQLSMNLVLGYLLMLKAHRANNRTSFYMMHFLLRLF